MIDIKNNTCIVVGCSCISREQLQFFTTRQHISLENFKTGIFDWLIATPQTTIEILNSLINGSIRADLLSRENYVFHHHSVRNIKFHGLYYVHHEGMIEDDEKFKVFQSRINHVIENVERVTESETKKVLLWSNVQPNLPSEAAKWGYDWNDFTLTTSHYNEIKKLSKQYFGESTECLFITRAEDAAVDDSATNDIFFINLDKNPESISNWKGSLDLFDPMLSKFLL